VIRRIPSFRVDRSFGIKVSGTGHPGLNPSLSSLGSIALAERRRPGRKLMFWLSPGWKAWDNAFDEITEFSTRLREARIALWSWPYPDRDLDSMKYLNPVTVEKNARAGDLSLGVLALQSGGGMLNTSNELAAMIGECIKDESVIYTLTFDPPLTNQADEYHNLKVTVGKPGLTARTNAGYYNEPVYQDHPSEARHVTVAELEQMLEMAHGAKDNEVAQELAGLELTERMSSAKLLAWKARLPGERSKAALVAVADRSVFLALPTAEIPATATPDTAARRQILSRTIDYLSKTIVKLPDFFAMRTTVQYDEPPQKDETAWKVATSNQSFHVTQTFNTTVTYRNGKEVVDAAAREEETECARAGAGYPRDLRPHTSHGVRGRLGGAQRIYLKPLGTGLRRDAGGLPLCNPAGCVSFRSGVLLPRGSRRNHFLQEKCSVSRRGHDRSGERGHSSPDSGCGPRAEAADVKFRHHGRVRSGSDR
jgi:hypothetical protein